MKKAILILAAILLAAGPAMAATAVPLTCQSGSCFSSESYTLFSAITSTGTGSGTTYYFTNSGKIVPVAKHTCSSTWGGTGNPTQVVYYIEGSQDGTNFGTSLVSVATVTMTQSPYLFHIADKPIRYIRGNIVSFTGGTAPSLTLSCSSGGF